MASHKRIIGMTGRFVEVGKRNGLRVNTDKYCDGSWRGGWIGMYMPVIFFEIQVLEICVR